MVTDLLVPGQQIPCVDVNEQANLQSAKEPIKKYDGFCTFCFHRRLSDHERIQDIQVCAQCESQWETRTAEATNNYTVFYTIDSRDSEEKVLLRSLLLIRMFLLLGL